MAYYPCEAGPHFNPARNYLIYIGITRGQESERYKLRFCRTHLAGIEENLAQYEIHPEDATVSPRGSKPNCFSCGKPADQLCRDLFFTTYPPENERKDYWSSIHDHCSMPEMLSPTRVGPG